MADPPGPTPRDPGPTPPAEPAGRPDRWDTDAMDREWVAVNEVVLAGLDDAHVLERPPSTEADIGQLADAITDRLVAVFRTTRRSAP